MEVGNPGRIRAIPGVGVRLRKGVGYIRKGPEIRASSAFTSPGVRLQNLIGSPAMGGKHMSAIPVKAKIIATSPQERPCLR
jgi:hypothetical protein